MVSNLEHLKPIIKNLEYTSIPFSMIDERRLQDAKEDGRLSEENYNAINNWIQNELGFKNTKGYLQSIVSLLKNLDIVENVKIPKEELDQPLGLSGPMLESFLEKTTNAIQLTNPGYKLCELLKQGNDNSMNNYYDLLFWKFLTSDMVHNFQRLIEDKDSYTKGIEKCLEKYEDDAKSRTMFKLWTKYFELTDLGSDKLFPKKIAKKIIMASIFEMNLLEKNVYSIQKLLTLISQRLRLSSNLINFEFVLEIIVSGIYSSDIESKAIEGQEASRSSMSLPNFPKINMLKINKKIESTIDWKKISNQTLENVMGVQC